MRKNRIFSLLIVASAAALIGLSAQAQMYPGDDVIVNPAAMPHNPLAPGSPYPGIVLHPPHRHHPRALAKADPRAPDAGTQPVANPAPEAALPAEQPPPPPKPKHHAAPPAQAVQAATADTGSSSVPFSFGEDTPAPPAKTASPTPMQTAKPVKAEAVETGLAKRGAILFEHNATDPQPSQLDGIKLLAGDLNTALEAGATQIQLQAFGGTPGDRSSEARRISLKRALAIRQLLIDNGVPSTKIVTKAMGGITDSGEPDRVDIYVRA